jgi:hypothetical protein
MVYPVLYWYVKGRPETPTKERLGESLQKKRLLMYQLEVEGRLMPPFSSFGF